MHRFVKWREALQYAPDVNAVNTVIGEYVAGLLPSDLARFPRDCQAALTERVDIQETAVVLLQAELMYTGPEESAAILHEVAHTFAAASLRLGQLRNRDNPGAD